MQPEIFEIMIEQGLWEEKKERKGGEYDMNKSSTQVLGAPNASGILSILYFLLFMNIIGTPGTFHDRRLQYNMIIRHHQLLVVAFAKQEVR